MHKRHRRAKTTRSPGGLVKKTFWFHQDEADRLRLEAFEQELSQAELVRRAVRLMFDMPEPAVVTGEDLAEDLAEALETVPDLRQQLSQLLEDYASSPEKAAEVRRALEAKDGD